MSLFTNDIHIDENDTENKVWGGAFTWDNNGKANLSLTIYNYHSKEEMLEQLKWLTNELEETFKEQEIFETEDNEGEF